MLSNLLCFHGKKVLWKIFMNLFFGYPRETLGSESENKVAFWPLSANWEMWYTCSWCTSHLVCGYRTESGAEFHHRFHPCNRTSLCALITSLFLSLLVLPAVSISRTLEKHGHVLVSTLKLAKKEIKKFHKARQNLETFAGIVHGHVWQEDYRYFRLLKWWCHCWQENDFCRNLLGKNFPCNRVGDCCIIGLIFILVRWGISCGRHKVEK